MRLLLTAGHDRALHVVALAELLQREGHRIAGILVVTPFNWGRLKGLMRQRGHGFLRDAALRLLPRPRLPRDDDPLLQFLASHRIAHRSLRAWAGGSGPGGAPPHSAWSRVPYHTVRTLNGPRAIRVVEQARADGVLYGGGGILGPQFLQAAGGRVLNAHAGPLPQIRGMNALEWSLLLGVAPTSTIHVIDREIDTGGVIEAIPVPVEPGDTLERLRAKSTVTGVQGLCRAVSRLQGKLPDRSGDAASSRQCFVLAPVLRELLEARLALLGRILS